MDVGLLACVLVEENFDELSAGFVSLLKVVGCEKIADVDPMVDIRTPCPATEVSGAGLGFSKRLQQKRQLKEIAQAVSEKSHRLMQLMEVAGDDSEELLANEDSLERKAGSGGTGRPSWNDAVTVT